MLLFIHERSYKQRTAKLPDPVSFKALSFIQANGATIEYRATQGQRMQIGQNLLLNETDNNTSFCYSMIWK